MDIVMKCKDVDAWVSFLGRLNKIGSGFVIKNDIIIPTIKGKKSGSNDKIPGRHITRDPLFIDDETCYVKNGLYVPTYELDEMINIFKIIKKDNKDARKKIVLTRTKKGIYITFQGMRTLTLFSLLDRNYYDEKEYNKYINVTSSLHYFDDYISGISNWNTISSSDLIDLRNNGLKILRQNVNGINIWARVARSIFTMSGVTRIDSPLAQSISYTFLHSDGFQKDTAILRINAEYNAPGGSKLIKVNCIHEYAVLIYDEEYDVDDK